MFVAPGTVRKEKLKLVPAAMLEEAELVISTQVLVMLAVVQSTFVALTVLVKLI